MEKTRVIARIVAKSGCEETLRELLSGLLEPTHAEAGCEVYELYESNEPGRFYFYEVWTDQASLDAHLETPHLMHLKAVVGDLIAEPLEINLLRSVS